MMLLDYRLVLRRFAKKYNIRTAKLPLFSQRKKFFYMGQLMAMSLAQEGSGFPYIAPPVYEYLCGAQLSTIDPTVEDVPNLEVKSSTEELLNIADSKKK